MLAESTQFLVLITISLMSIIILFPHLRLDLPKGIFPVDLPVTILPTSPAHLTLIDLIILILLSERYKQ